jgi:formylglycine-generating enzyme required for sulfatase activity
MSQDYGDYSPKRLSDEELAELTRPRGGNGSTVIPLARHIAWQKARLEVDDPRMKETCWSILRLQDDLKAARRDRDQWKERATEHKADAARYREALEARFKLNVTGWNGPFTSGVSCDLCNRSTAGPNADPLNIEHADDCPYRALNDLPVCGTISAGPAPAGAEAEAAEFRAIFRTLCAMALCGPVEICRLTNPAPPNESVFRVRYRMPDGHQSAEFSPDLLEALRKIKASRDAEAESGTISAGPAPTDAGAEKTPPAPENGRDAGTGGAKTLSVPEELDEIWAELRKLWAYVRLKSFVQPVQPAPESSAERPRIEMIQIRIEMIQIPAGPFLYGPDKKTVELPAFEIAKYPVTNEQYKVFLDHYPGLRPPEHWINGLFPSDKARHPVANISWHDAQACAKWYGLRLPTEQEWEKAARGTDGREYPWGDAFDPKKCNCFESGTGDTTPVGAYPSGASPYGVMDMAGNVWEWTSSEWGDGYDTCVLRGGSWNSTSYWLRASYRYGNDPGSGNYTGGFRFSRTL